MSNRTVQANKAVMQAWKKEYTLVSEGKGTREWTLEQQRDILDRGKAYGVDGRAFEGHHMKSVEEYPDFQGDSGNIQFLSKSEHIDAHNGCFLNPTNGYFDPITCETKGFSDKDYEPCAVLELSNPIVTPEIIGKNVIKEEDNIQIGNESSQKTDDSSEPKRDEAPPAPHMTYYPPNNERKVSPIKRRFLDGVKHTANLIKEFSVRHPVITEFAKFTVKAELVHLADRAISRGVRSKGIGSNTGSISPFESSGDSNIGFSGAHDSTGKKSIEISQWNERTSTGTPKAPHDTSGYTRIKNGKKENVSGYSTGKNRDK